MVVFLQPLVNRLAPETIFFAVGSMKIVKADEEAGAVTQMFLLDAVDLLLGTYPQFFCCQHDSGAVGVVGTDVNTMVPAGLLEPYPDIGLYLFQQVAQMQRAIGIGQCACNEDFAWSGCCHEGHLLHKTALIVAFLRRSFIRGSC